MSSWTPPALATLHARFTLHLSAGPAGPDAPEVEVGMVVVGDELYVRPLRGTTSQWYRAAVSHGEGRIRVADETLEVSFEAAEPGNTPAVDAAYQNKYGTLATFATSPPSRLATLRISPL